MKLTIYRVSLNKKCFKQKTYPKYFTHKKALTKNVLFSSIQRAHHSTSMKKHLNEHAFGSSVSRKLPLLHKITSARSGKAGGNFNFLFHSAI